MLTEAHIRRRAKLKKATLYLLAALIGGLLVKGWSAPPLMNQRFLLHEDGGKIALDTATGQLCDTSKALDKDDKGNHILPIPYCVDLAEK
jgi:hypothetical protein